MNKTKVYLWTNDVQIVKMSSDHQVKGRENAGENGSLENAANVMQCMLPSNDVEALCRLIVEAVRISEGFCEDDSLMTQRIYNKIMSQGTFSR